VELAGLEPATSWVRCGVAVETASAQCGLVEPDAHLRLASWSVPHGFRCRRMTADLGTGSSLVPNRHLGHEGVRKYTEDISETD
jgi:hypothetical protein